MGTEAKPDTDAGLEPALQALRAAVAAREAEHHVQARQRLLFGRVTMLSLLVLLIALYVTGKSFDPQIFTSALAEKMGSSTSSILGSLKIAATELTPVYRKEVERTFVPFSESLVAAMAEEGEKLSTTLMPMTSGDPGGLTADADDQFAGMLADTFKEELGGDKGKAKLLASALRAQEIKSAHSAIHEELGGPFAALGEIQDTVKGMGPPDKTVMDTSEVVDAVGAAALEVIKTKLASGEKLGFGDDSKGAKGAKKDAAKKGGQ